MPQSAMRSVLHFVLVHFVHFTLRSIGIFSLLIKILNLIFDNMTIISIILPTVLPSLGIKTQGSCKIL